MAQLIPERSCFTTGTKSTRREPVAIGISMSFNRKHCKRQMDICAVICTCGGRRTLEAAVASLAEQTLDAERYEVIVVLNRNSESHLRKLDKRRACPPQWPPPQGSVAYYF